MKRRFRNTNFRPDSLARIAQMDAIVREYARQNLRLTARQLYYQFVSRDFIPNTPRSYDIEGEKRLGVGVEAFLDATGKEVMLCTVLPPEEL